MDLVNNLLVINIVTWAILGLLSGFVVHIIDGRAAQGGLLGSLLYGMLGAICGGLFANLLFGFNFAAFDLGSSIIAIAAAIIISLIFRIISLKNTTEDEELTSRPEAYTPLYSGYSPDLTYYSDISPPHKSNRATLEIQKYLHQINYPVSKRDLISLAKRSSASEETLSTLERLPDHIYDNADHLNSQLRQL